MRGFWLKLGSCRRAVAVTLMGTASNMFGSRQIEKAAAADGRLGAKKPTKLQLAHTDTTQPTTTTPSVWRGRSLEGLEGSEEDEGKLSQVPRCVVCPPPASAVRGSFNVFVPPWHLNAHLQGQIPPSSVHHKRRLRMNAQSVQGDENGE